MPIRAVPPIAISFIARAEACHLKPYPDATGNWTDGYGHRRTGDGSPITADQAIAQLRADCDTAANRLSDVISEYEILKLAEHEYAALISFVFNLGAGKDWQIWNYLNKDDLAQVPGQMLRFDHGKVNGQLVEIKGLKNRRLAEIALWNTADVEASVGVIGPVHEQPPSSYVRDIETPPAPPAPKPLASASLTAKIVTGLGAVGATASQVQGIVQPHASEAHSFQMIAVGLSGVIMVAAVLALLISHKQQAVAAT